MDYGLLKVEFVPKFLEYTAFLFLKQLWGTVPRSGMFTFPGKLFPLASCVGCRQEPCEQPPEATGEAAAQTRCGEEIAEAFHSGEQLAECSCAGCSGDTEKIKALCWPQRPAVQWDGQVTCREGEPRARAQGTQPCSSRGGRKYLEVGRSVSLLICGVGGRWHLK